MFRHRSATPAGVTGNGEVRSLGDNVTSILGSVVNRASRHGDCQHQGGRGPAVRGMVNPGEVLIKVVKIRQAKDAVRLEPKGTWSGTGALRSPVADRRTTGREARPKPRVDPEVNEVTPLSPREGRPTAKDADEAAGKG